MRYEIVHEQPGRMRLRCGKWLFDDEGARGISQALCQITGVEKAVAHAANGSILVQFDSEARGEILAAVDGMDVWDLPQATDDPTNDLATIDNRFQMQLLQAVGWRLVRRAIVPFPLRRAWTVVKAAGYAYKGIRALLRMRLSVEVLDATAIGAAVLMKNYSTASSVMFLLHISDILSEYTQARTRSALRENLAICADTVWRVEDGIETEVPLEQIRVGDTVRVRTGAMIPLDGTVVDGEAEVNEATMTGEAALARKAKDSTVYAGTAVDTGSLLVRADAIAGQSRIDGIVDLVENSQELKASVQSRAERLADAMVPFSLGMFLFVLLVTRNITRAMSVLMVDYSCAIKLSTPIAVMSAMREATRRRVVAKGGKYLEAFAKADAIVFDKTGTLTSAQPVVQRVITFNGTSEEEVLRIAACLEEHFPHSMANAIVKSAHDAGLHHPEENHAEVEYVVAHGIASSIGGRKACIGSAHFVFDDEGVPKPAGLVKRLDREAPGASTVFLAIDGKLSGALCISDPLRPEAADIITRLRERGFKQVVMLTGDSENCAAAVADKLGLDEYHAQVLPEDKAGYIEGLRAEGHTVVMVGDGVNDSPALATANVSVALSDASDIARMVADVAVLDASLESLVELRDLSTGLMNRIESSYRFIVSFNSALILLGLMGIVPAATSAMLHNLSTVGLAAANTRPLLPGDGKANAVQNAAGTFVDSVSALPAAKLTAQQLEEVSTRHMTKRKRETYEKA